MQPIKLQQQNVYKQTNIVRKQTAHFYFLSQPFNCKKKTLSTPSPQIPEQKPVDSIELLFGKWQKIYSSIIEDLSAPGFISNKISEDEEESESFERCKNLLKQQYESDKNRHFKLIKAMEKKLLEVKMECERIEQIKKNIKEYIDKMKSEKQFAQDQLNQNVKKAKFRTDLQEKIKTEREKINNLHKRLYECKGISYDQKNEFTELQGEEFKLTQFIQQFQQQEKIFKLNLRNRERYHKLQLLKQKLQAQKKNENQEIITILDKKISSAAMCRTNISSLDEVLRDCQTKVQEQTYIIEALKIKVEQQEEQRKQENMFAKFKNRYQEIYFEQRDREWEDYKEYLKQLLDRNDKEQKTDTPVKQAKSKDRSSGWRHQQRNSLNRSASSETDSQKEFSKSSYRSQAKRDSMKSQIFRNEKPELYADRQQQDKSVNGRSKRINSEPIVQKSVKLPKVSTKFVKMEGSADEGKAEEIIRQRLVEELMKKPENEREKFDVVSVRSNEDAESGEFIEVQFHKANRLK